MSFYYCFSTALITYWQEKDASGRDADGKQEGGGEDLMDKKDPVSELHEAARKGNVEQIKALSAANPDILKYVILWAIKMRVTAALRD